MKRWFKLLLALLTHLGAPALAWAQAPAALAADFQGLFHFAAAGARLSATLSFPASASPRHPLVVILHGGTGLSELEPQDVRLLNASGYATAVVDSVGGRNLPTDPVSGQVQGLRPPARVVDAYAALAVLATHPRIDASRVALFGRSAGGAAAMIAATRWAKDRHGAAGPGFRAVLALYPSCGARYPEFASLAAPVRLHLAGRDELTPARHCEALVARLQAGGGDISARTYPQAHHAFDLPHPVQYFPGWTSFADCSFDLPSVDAVLSQQELQRCARRGTRIGGDRKSLEQFQAHLLSELQALLQ